MSASWTQGSFVGCRLSKANNENGYLHLASIAATKLRADPIFQVSELADDIDEYALPIRLQAPQVV